jgi:hypothetical protein
MVQWPQTKPQTTLLHRVSYVLTAALFLAGVLSIAFLVDYALRAPDYRFGSEVAGWRYYSARHLISFAVFELLLAIAGLIAGLALTRARVLIQAVILCVVVLSALGTG